MKNPFFLLLITVSFSYAAEWKTPQLQYEGNTYRDVTVTLDGMKAVIRHEEGIRRMPVTALPPEALSALGYNDDYAKEAEKKAAEKNQANQNLLEAHRKALAEQKRAEAAKPPADQIFERRYEVLNNDPEGIIAEEFIKHTVQDYIPSASSRVGGGGGLSFERTEWSSTGVTVFIPHTKETANITGGEKFTATAWIDGSTHRTKYDELCRVHRILKLTLSKP